jgi:hypothetical protein
MLKFFDKDLDTMELKFLGLFFCLVLGIIALILKIDLITGFMASTISFIIRDLYRSSTNEDARQTHKTNGEAK